MPWQWSAWSWVTISASIRRPRRRAVAARRSGPQSTSSRSPSLSTRIERAQAAVARLGGVALAPVIADLGHAGRRAAAEDPQLHARAASVEQAEEIGGGGVGQRLGLLAAQLGDEGRGVGDEGRLAGLAAVGHRREERRVGLDQQPVERDLLGGFLQVAGILERHDARQRDEEAEVERLARQLGRAGEAVEHAASRPLPDRARQGSRRYPPRHRGCGRPAAGRSARAASICASNRSRCACAVGLVVIIIEPALADRDDLRMRRRLDQRRGAKVGMRVGLVRVDADAGPDVGIALGGGDDVVPFALAGRDVEESRSTPRARAASSTSSCRSARPS